MVCVLLISKLGYIYACASILLAKFLVVLPNISRCSVRFVASSSGATSEALRGPWLHYT